MQQELDLSTAEELSQMCDSLTQEHLGAATDLCIPDLASNKHKDTMSSNPQSATGTSPLPNESPPADYQQ